MESQDSYKQGDPRRVLAMAKENSNQTSAELLWGCQDPAESLRMAKIIVEGGFLALTLNEDGARSFTFLKDASPGVREAYFVDHFAMGGISEAPMLLGQFLFEFEKYPEEAFNLSSGGTNRIYFRMNGPGQKDRRIENYGLLTEDEITNVRSRLQALAVKQPHHQETINRIIATLDK
jgi:hypothetical protein